MKLNYRENFRRNIYEGIVLGLPHPEDRGMVKRHKRFLREFAGCPEAEQIRSRYRVAIFVLIMGSVVVGAIPTFVHIGSSQFRDVWWSWAVIVNAPMSMVLPNIDHFYVRSVLRTRARLAARGVPRTAEKLLWFFLPPETCDEAIDDLNAKFEARKVKFGTSWARWWYRWQVARSLSPSFDLLIERLIKWGVLGWIGRHF